MFNVNRSHNGADVIKYILFIFYKKKINVSWKEEKKGQNKLISAAKDIGKTVGWRQAN